MKLVSYRADADSVWRAGVLVGDLVVDAASVGLEGAWSSVRSVLAHPRAALRDLARGAEDQTTTLGRPRAELTLGPPVPDAEKILCVGLNYVEHQLESKEHVAAAAELPRWPLIFTKFASCLIGDGAPIEPPAATSQLDYEAELAVVIGAEARDVPLETALDHVAGYMPFNDVSARDLQLRSAQWTMGKAFDTSGPCGPWLVTTDEIPDPQNLEITGRLNGEVMQSSSTALMIFSVAQLIEYISQAVTLVPGDIIVTGTPAGVAMGRQPPNYMKPGDVYEVEIESVGTLANPVVAPRSDFVSRLELEPVSG